MTYEDYLIHSSELQHAFWSKKRPKYFKKDNGRYFYSRQEWEAFINKGRKKLDKAVTRFKKDATKQFKSYQKSAKKAQKRRSMERMERSRKFKQGLVDTKYALQNFSKNVSKKMSELKASASKQISRGKGFAVLCFANVRGQMNRFNDKVVKPGMAKAKAGYENIKFKAKAAAERINVAASRKIEDLKKTDLGKKLASGKALISLVFERYVTNPIRLSRLDKEVERAGMDAHNARIHADKATGKEKEDAEIKAALAKAHLNYVGNEQWKAEEIEDTYEEKLDQILKSMGFRK